MVQVLDTKRALLISFSLLLSALMFVQLSFAQARTVGIAEGDWFKYGFTFEYDGELNVTAEEFPFSEFLEGDMFTLTIQDISGTNVTGQFTIHYGNGTEQNQTGSVDIVTGEGEMRNWLISADLNVNDSIYTSEVNERINETSPQPYPWGSRETNHLMYSYNYSSGEDFSELNLDMLWDQELGILTELSFEAEVQQNGTYMEAYAAWILTETNSEQLPEFTQPALILAIVVTATIIASIIKKRKV